MVKATRGNYGRMIIRADILTTSGILVKCDASIKAMLVDIDSKSGNEYIIEELDEEHILVKETRINELKARLNQMMKERLKEPESSDSE
ncbi:hypothetical protein PTRG_01738 [Pyrenophora tritici-repentis Pt-1C-BFP]|uniref:General transcription and DNA repair factor IIH subunit TFB5 n=1 Tax=Pyrenophora tritici-repentis (strain Pt-1C-BFP) TaxID=426418 RepID=B2VSB2_PYRTR|nr:uncharacterized protein PTRG_01738 [Pyrenophora tritici-repentis Pt-1C-BFP]EDU41176.1 hypothetical protein PTRG_01738 [Pyrenophora tritici-repentis Pt-1C-BFP]